MIQIIYMLLSIFLAGFSLFLTIKNFSEYRSKFNLEMIGITSLTSFWLIFSEIHQFSSEVMKNMLQLIGNIGFIAIVLVYLRMSFIFSKFALSRSVKITSKIAFMGLAILLGMKIGDILIIGDNVIFASPGQISKYPLISVLIFIAHLSFSLIFLQANFYFYRRMYHQMEATIERIANVTVFLILGSIPIIFIYAGVNVFNQYLALSFLPFTKLIIGSSIYGIIQYVSTNPVILLTNKANTRKLIDNGYIGYYLVSVKDDGPTILQSSEKFDQKYEIDFSSRMLFATAKITVVGIGNSFKNSIFSIPFPKHTDLNTVSISFFHDDPTLTDPRMKGTASAVYSIVVPNSLSPLISINFDVMPIFQKFVDHTSDISEFATKRHLDIVTEQLMRQII